MQNETDNHPQLPGSIIDLEKKQQIQIGLRLRQIRKEKNMSQTGVAKQFHLRDGQATISAYETGRIPLGKHGLQMYVALLGAASAYILEGKLPMFADPQKGEYQREQVLGLLDGNKRGNLQFVGWRNVGSFLDMGFTLRVPYYLVDSECFGFPVADYELGPDYPFGSMLICTRFESKGLKVGRIYVFQTQTELVMRIYSGVNPGRTAYLLTSAYGPERNLAISEVVQVYHVDRIDKPVL